MPPEADHARSLHLYVLDDESNPHRVEDIEAWAEWMNGRDQTLAHTRVSADVQVTTEFLGNDQRRTKTGAPLLWETMISGGRHHRHQVCYASRADALLGHQRAVALAKAESD
jgi:hypothetical protein